MATRELGPPLRHRPRLQAFGRAALRALGWRIVGELPREPRFVAIVAPHTSNWDFFVGVGLMFALDLDVHWFGKDTLFRGPVGAALRKLGGRPVKRTSSEGIVAEVAGTIRAAEQFIVALAPEGTRRRVIEWRTGFYRIAQAADIPILPVWLDWSRHEVGLGTPMRPTGDVMRDVGILRALYRPDMARHPADFVGAPPPDAVAQLDDRPDGAQLP